MDLVRASLIWYGPGWLRCHTPQEGVLERLGETFPEARIEFREWNGDIPVWPKAVESADAAVEEMVSRIAALPEAERRELTLVGHSLGGRITARTLARLGERGLRIRQGVLMAAAIPSRDADLTKMAAGSEMPVLAICNPDDVTLKYVFATAEATAAYGANGYERPLAGVMECVVPASITRETKIDRKWAEVQVARDIANHHALFYLECLNRVALGARPSGRVMVPQDFITVEWPVLDRLVWWELLAEHAGWRLERNRVTGHARILDPGKVRRAWGSADRMKAAFDKVREQVTPVKDFEKRKESK